MSSSGNWLSIFFGACTFGLVALENERRFGRRDRADGLLVVFGVPGGGFEVPILNWGGSLRFNPAIPPLMFEGPVPLSTAGAPGECCEVPGRGDEINEEVDVGIVDMLTPFDEAFGFKGGRFGEYCEVTGAGDGENAAVDVGSADMSFPVDEALGSKGGREPEFGIGDFTSDRGNRRCTFGVGVPLRTLSMFI